MLIGTYHDVIFDRRTTKGPVPDNIILADNNCIDGLTHLLTTADHRARLERGDVVLALLVDDRPVALQWLNRVMHQDRYLGRASRPTTDMAYINQSIVQAEYRNRGLMGHLMEATVHVAHDLGVDQVRAMVDVNNRSMRAVMDRAGFVERGQQRGVRIGSRFTLRFNS